MDLLKDSVKNLYFRYLFPSMGSAVVASVYLMTDAVVIGKGIGDNALAALNMTTPIISFMLSIGILFGIGGSVLFSVHKGTGDDEKANKCFTTALLGVLTAAPRGVGLVCSIEIAVPTVVSSSLFKISSHSSKAAFSIRATTAGVASTASPPLPIDTASCSSSTFIVLVRVFSSIIITFPCCLSRKIVIYLLL